MTPSVVSILARWLPSRTSSTISGWRSSALPTRSARSCVGDVEVHPDRWHPGRASSCGQLGQGGVAQAFAELPVDDRDDPDGAGRARLASRRDGGRRTPPGSRRASGQRARPGSGGSRPSASRPPAALDPVASIAWVASVGAGPRPSIRARDPARPPSASDGGTATAVTIGRDHEQPDHDRGRLARRPFLERLDDERVAQRPVAQRPPG